jgi:hypothetical protein
MPELDQLKDLSASLAAELAADLLPASEVFKKFGYTDADAKRMMADDRFIAMIQDARSEWASIKNSKQRLRIKARLALEEAIPVLFEMVNDWELPAPARVAAFKELKDASAIASAGAEEQAGSGSGLPSVTIYLGDPNGPSVTVNGNRKKDEEDDDVYDAEFESLPEINMDHKWGDE